ncbi:MAG: hypothetical protein JWL77_5954 [Chthonomonadaceae bacterium]|nr:hypothetical protein [Chthonomonadaceae bacterium]
MSHVVSMRLPDRQMSRLQRYARTLGKTPGEVGAMLIEEQLREVEFAFIEFRASPIGRHAHMKGSRLTVWWVVHVATEYAMNAAQVAAHFQRPLAWAQAALNYYADFPEEIDLAIEDHRATDFEAIKRAFPTAQIMEISLEDTE